MHIYVYAIVGRNPQFKKLTNILVKQLESTKIVPPAIQPYHALMLSFSGEQQLEIAKKFALQAKMNVALLEMPHFASALKSQTIACMLALCPLISEIIQLGIP